MARNEAWVSVGRDHDTPTFAVASIRHWWRRMGEIRTAAQLDAVRHDLDGDGDPGGAAAHTAAYPGADVRMGCPSGGCTGYELGNDIDLDTDSSGDAGPADAYWNGGAGWLPIGAPGAPFAAVFEGNGRTVRHLYISRGAGVGLFGVTDASSVIRHVGLRDVAVAGSNDVGGLVGSNAGTVAGSYTTGSVSGTGERVGGLAGRNQTTGAMRTSYSTARVSGNGSVAGLVGEHDGALTAGYATGRVSGTRRVGGLVGRNQSTGTVVASYSTAHVVGTSETGGLVGAGSGTVTASYWDTSTSGHTLGDAGRTTSALQTPTDYSGPYQTWNVDLNGDSVADAPWDFGTATQYPALAVDADRNGQATWQELGRQVRAGPRLTAVAPVGKTLVELSWTAADVSHWSPLPGVAYTVIRDDGAITVVGESLAGLSATDSDVTAGTTYAYQVAAVVEGGEPARSSLVEVTVVGNRAPTAVGELADRTLPVADGAVSLDVAGAYEDLDGDALTYGATSSSSTVATASLSGSILTVNPLRAGTATVTVTATDVAGSNATATQRFAVTVVNLSPQAVGTIADRSVQVSDGVFMVDVSGAFQDPEGDALTYRAVSSDSSVASVTVSGSTVSVTPLSGGTATMTVTATDAEGSNTSATQTLDVTVASRPPEAVGTLAPLSLRVADGVRSVNVSGAFRDPDGDALETAGNRHKPRPQDRPARQGETLTPLQGKPKDGTLGKGRKRPQQQPGVKRSASALGAALQRRGAETKRLPVRFAVDLRQATVEDGHEVEIGPAGGLEDGEAVRPGARHPRPVGEGARIVGLGRQGRQLWRVVVELGIHLIIGLGLGERIGRQVRERGAGGRRPRDGAGGRRRGGKQRLRRRRAGRDRTPAAADGSAAAGDGGDAVGTTLRRDGIDRRPRRAPVRIGVIDEGLPAPALQVPGAIEIEERRRRPPAGVRIVTLEQGDPGMGELAAENGREQQRVDGLDEQPGHAVGRTDHAEATALALDRRIAREDGGDEILARRRHEGHRREGSRGNVT